MTLNYIKFLITTLFVGVFANQAWAQDVPAILEIANLKLHIQPLARQDIQNRIEQLKANQGDFRAKLEQADLYLPLVHEMLADAGLPTDLKYLSLLDSNLPDSLVFWQMDNNLAESLGLRVNRLIDERQNILAVTKAVAQKLKGNHKLLNNWIFTMLSYRLSVSEVKDYLLKNFQDFDLSQLTRTQNLDISSFMHSDILQFFANYLAFKDELGKNPNKKTELVICPESNNKTFALLSEEYGVSVQKLRQYNPWLKTEVIPNDKKYEVIIPVSAESPTTDVDVFSLKSGQLTYQTAVETFYHVIEKGESLFAIARSYGIAFKDLLTANRMTAQSKIFPGQKLIIPSTIKFEETSSLKPSITPSRLVSNTKAIVHTVQKGETLYRISKQYQVSVSDIQDWNNMSSTELRIGQALRINVKKNDFPPHKPVEIPKIPEDKPQNPSPNTKPKPTPTGTRKVNPKTVPSQLVVGGITLKITPEARQMIQKDVDFLLKNAQYFLNKLTRVDMYMPLIEKTLQEQGVPLDFKYLPIQESTLVGNAVSSSNAVGYWQFKAPSAVEVGMNVNAQVDERMNIISATIGASKYLKRNNLHFQNWISTLLSYNMGFTGAKNHLAFTYPDKNLKNPKEMIIDRQVHWYVRKFLAHKVAFETEIGVVSPSKTLNEYTEGKYKSLFQIANEQGVTTEAMRPHNFWLKNTTVPNDKVYSVIVPK
jgi:LysM repeat protein